MRRQYFEIIPGPGVIKDDFELIRKRVQMVAPYVDWVQIDIADNVFVPNETSLDPQKYKQALSGIRVNLELHMMVENPLQEIKRWKEAGFRRFILHIETFLDQKSAIRNPKLTEEIRRLKSDGLEVGLAVDKKTPIDTLFPFLDDVDCVLVMTIAAGFSGQIFVPELLDKVRILRKISPSLPIEVDGGINYDTAKLAIDAGVSRLAVTSTIYNSENIKEAIERLKSS